MVAALDTGARQGELLRLRWKDVDFEESVIHNVITSNVKDSWEAARNDADLEHVRFHDLRHTAATKLAKKMQLVFVGHVLGHSDPKTTRRYVNKTRQTILEAGAIMDECTKDKESN